MSTTASLLDSIIQSAHSHKSEGWLEKDTTLRLVYADQLEEEGDIDRAAFIRCQCELASTPKCICVGECCGDKRMCPYAYWWWNGGEVRNVELRKQEKELLGHYGFKWFKETFGFQMGYSEITDGIWNFTRYDGMARVSGPIKGCVFQRGFPEYLSIPLKSWTGGKCRRCWTPQGQYVPWTDGCPGKCDGGMFNTWGPELVRLAPLTEVRISDKHPFSNSLVANPHWYCWDESVVEEPEDIPRNLWNRLKHGTVCDVDTVRTRYRFYDRSNEAWSDLSEALLAMAREETTIGN